MTLRKFSILLVLIIAANSIADIFNYDFDESIRVTELKEFDFENYLARLQNDESGSKYLSIRNTQKGRYCRFRIRKPFTFDQSLALSFSAKAEAINSQVDYIAISLFSGKESYFFGSTRISSSFENVKFHFSQLKAQNESYNKPLKIDYIDIYTRASDDTSITMSLDDIRLGVDVLTKVSYNSPPFFNWEKIGRSILQYSKDISFQTDVVTVNTDYNFHTPDYNLSAGKWYWRVRSENEEKWNAVSCIEIPEKHHTYIAKPIDWKTLSQKPHPRLPVSQEDLDKDRDTLREQYLRLKEQKIPEDPPTFENSNMEKWDYHAYIRNVIKPAANRLQRIAELYILLSDEDIKETLIDWTWQFLEWDPQGGSSTDNGDLPLRDILRAFSRCYDGLYYELTQEQRKEFEEYFITRILQWEQHLGNPFPVNTNKEFNNHAWSQARVLLESALVLSGEDERANKWIEYTRDLMTGLFLCGLGFQGENCEGIGYGSYGAIFIQQYVSLLREVTGNNLFDHPWLQNTPRFPMYCAVKNSWAVSFSNSHRPNHGYKAMPRPDDQWKWSWKTIYNNVKNITRNTARECEDPYGIWYSGDYSYEPIEPKPPIDLDPSIHYEHIGWAIQNTDLVDGSEGVTFGIRSGPFLSAHQHEDQNGFVINAYGDKIAIKSGYYDFYGSEHFDKYSIRSQAQNVILVNGKGQDSKKPGADGKIEEFFSSPAYGFILADGSNQKMYESQLEKWKRNILFIKPRYIIIYDDLKSKNSAKYDWLLHSVEEFSIDDNEFSFDSENASLKGKFLLPSNIEITQTKGYPILPVGLPDSRIKPEDVEDEWTLKAVSDDQDILTILQTCKAKDRDKDLSAQIIESPEDLLAFKISNTTEQNTIIINKEGKDFKLDGIETDAKRCILTFDKNMSVKGFFANSGSYLKHNNTELFKIKDGGKVNISAQVQPDLTVYTTASTQENKIYLASENHDFYSKTGQLEYSPDEGIEIKGSNTFTTGAKAAEYFDRKLEAIDWAGVKLQGYDPNYVNNRKYWWGRVKLDEDTKVKVAANSNDVKIFIDDYRLLSDGKDTMQLDKGYHFIQVSSENEDLRLKVTYDLP